MMSTGSGNSLAKSSKLSTYLSTPASQGDFGISHAPLKAPTTGKNLIDLTQYPERAIQLLSIENDSKNTLKLNPQALEILSSIPSTTRLAVICVAGPYRSGKSFLLNRLLGRSDGFEIGGTVQSCTRGIWMWGRPVKISEDLHAIFLDTEGLGSCERDLH